MTHRCDADCTCMCGDSMAGPHFEHSPTCMIEYRALFCVHCGLMKTEHAGGRCLYAPTHFTPYADPEVDDA